MITGGLHSGKNWAAAMALALAAVGFSGCKIADVKRQDEVNRFDKYMKDQKQKLQPQTSKVLAMHECEQIAIANSLDLRLRTMGLKISDDRVNLALTGYLPNASLVYLDSNRSNNNLVKQDGMVVKAGDQRERDLALAATIPILDWGITYYSYQIAKDARKQDDLVIARTTQLLVRDVRIAYVKHAGAIRREALLQQALLAAREVQRIARSLEHAGETVRADTALVDASVAQAELDLALQQKERSQTMLDLAQLMSLPPSVQFTIDNTMPAAPELPTAQGVEQMENRALQARPELAAQDLTVHQSAYEVKRQFANFFPRIDGVAGFNWSSNTQLVNDNWWFGGLQVSHGLLNGGADIWQYAIAKKQNEIETAKTLLLSLGVIYDVEMQALQVKQDYEVAKAAASLEYARQAAMEQVISLYKAGIQDPAGAARALADLTIQSTALDRAQQMYLVSWHELDAAVVPEHYLAPATTQPTTAPAAKATTQNTK